MRAEWWDKLQPDFEPDEFMADDAKPGTNRGTLAIALGGLIAGACDLTYAIAFYGAQGINPIRIPQSIASGLLGRDAYQGGWPTAALGVVLQFFIASCVAAVYYLASRKLDFLLRSAAVCGPLYGAAVFFFMRSVVLPLSAAPHFKSTALSTWTDFGVHVFLIGLPIALLARHYGSALHAQEDVAGPK